MAIRTLRLTTMMTVMKTTATSINQTKKPQQVMVMVTCLITATLLARKTKQRLSQKRVHRCGGLRSSSLSPLMICQVAPLSTVPLHIRHRLPQLLGRSAAASNPRERALVLSLALMKRIRGMNCTGVGAASSGGSKKRQLDIQAGDAACQQVLETGIEDIVDVGPVAKSPAAG